MPYSPSRYTGRTSKGVEPYCSGVKPQEQMSSEYGFTAGGCDVNSLIHDPAKTRAGHYESSNEIVEPAHGYRFEKESPGRMFCPGAKFRTDQVVLFFNFPQVISRAS